MASKNEEMDIVTGVVTSYKEAEEKEDGSGWKPATLNIDTGTGEAALVEYPKAPWIKNPTGSGGHYGPPYTPIKLPQFDALGLDTIVGKTIKALALPHGEFRGKPQLKAYYMGYTKVVGGDAKPEPDTQHRVPDTRPPASSLDQRIAWNSGVNNAVHALGPAGEDWDTRWAGDRKGQDYVERYVARVDALAHLLFHLIMRGPRLVETPEPEEEASLGVLTADGGE